MELLVEMVAANIKDPEGQTIIVSVSVPGSGVRV